MAAVVPLEPLTDDASLVSGKQVWESQCFTCHKLDGGGSIGPNMTDEYWIHGGTFADIINVINVGVPAKGMIPWRGVITDQQIQEVASYLLTLQGTNPPGGKPPEGEKISG
jgi:cytochrome c oxidase cbb3-type subunit 3